MAVKALYFSCRHHPNPGSAPSPSRLGSPELSHCDKEAGAGGLRQGASGEPSRGAQDTGPGGQDCERTNETASSEPGPGGGALRARWGGPAGPGHSKVQGPRGPPAGEEGQAAFSGQGPDGVPEARSYSSSERKPVTSIRAGGPGGEEGVCCQARHAPRPASASLLFRLGAQTRAFRGGAFLFLLPQHPSPTPEKAPGLEAQPERPWDGGGGPAPHSLQTASSIQAVQGKEGNVVSLASHSAPAALARSSFLQRSSSSKKEPLLGAGGIFLQQPTLTSPEGPDAGGTQGSNRTPPPPAEAPAAPSQMRPCGQTHSATYGSRWMNGQGSWTEGPPAGLSADFSKSRHAHTYTRMYKQTDTNRKVGACSHMCCKTPAWLLKGGQKHFLTPKKPDSTASAERPGPTESCP